MQQLVTLRTPRHRVPKTSEVTMASEHPTSDDGSCDRSGQPASGLPVSGSLSDSLSDSSDLPSGTSEPPAETASAQALHRLLRRQLRRHVDAAAFAPPITVVGFSDDQSEVLRIGIQQPEDAVLGMILPAQFSAIGVLAASVVATQPRRAHQDAALALGVLRTGEAASMLAGPNGDITLTSRPQGWLIDACRRAVGLPTVPCESAALSFPVTLWLDRIMVAIVNEPRRPVTWLDVAALCPVPSRWRSSDPVDLGTTLGSTALSWGSLRQLTVTGQRSPVGMRAEHARWMDDAMFARWCLGSFPELTSLRSDVEFLATDYVAQNIDLALRAAWVAYA